MPKLIIIVSLIIGIGVVLGVSGYFWAMPKSEVMINNEIETETNNEVDKKIDNETDQKEKLDIKTGRGELDEGIDVAKLQEEIDKGDQSWKLRYGCMGCTEEEVENAVVVPMRVEAELVLKEIGKSFGFTKEELDNFNLEKPFSEQGKMIYKIYHNSDLYVVTLTQPVVDYYKIWIISKIEFYEKECNPELIGIEIERKVNRIFEEKNGRLEQIMSPEQFKERGYNEYCVIWRNVTNLSADIINRLPESDLLERVISVKNWNLYKNNTIGFQFYYPEKWSHQEYNNGSHISFKDGIFNAPLGIKIDYFRRSGQWAIQDMRSIVVDGQKTYFLESGSEWSVKTYGVITSKPVSYLSKISVSGHDLYLEYVFSYNPQSGDASQTTQKHKDIFGGILSTFKFTEKEDISEWKTYQNEEYGFEINLFESWRGYKVFEESWKGTTLDNNSTKYEGPKIVIRNPKWSESEIWQDIPILVFTKFEWQLIEDKNLNIFAAPIAPSKLGENNKYVFSLPPRWVGFTDALGQDEAQKTVGTFKAIALNELSN